MNKAAAQDLRGVPARGRLVLALACTGQFMVILDVSIVNVALPSIRSGLGFSAAALPWVVNAYTLGLGGFLLLAGRLIDLHGVRPVLQAGIVTFTAASCVAGLSPDAGVLITARAVQGLGAAVLSPATLAVATTMFSGPARGRAVGAWSAVAAVGGVAGSLLGGILTGLLSWRWIFFINVPVGAALLGIAIAVLPAAGGRRRKRLDIAGALTVTGGLVLLVDGVLEIPQDGVTSPLAAGPMTGGLVLLACFAATEIKLAREPLLPPRLLLSRPVGAGALLMIMFGATSLSMWYFISLSLQDVMHMPPLAAGAAMVPFGAALAGCARLAPRLTSRAGPRPVITVGCLLTVAGFAWLSRLGAHSHYVTAMLGPGLIVSAGTGLVIAPLVTVATASVPRGQEGIASGLVNAARQIGGSLGLSVLSVIAAAAALPATSAAALAAGFGRAFAAAAVVSLLTAAAVLLLPRSRTPRKETSMTENPLPRPALARTVRGSGPGLVLAHGAGGSIAANYGPILDGLADSRTVVGADYPGSGQTPLSAGPLSLDELADQLIAAADAEGLASFAIVGWSLGAPVAIRAAVRNPDRVTALVLTAPFARADARLRLAATVWRDLYETGDPALVLRFLMLMARGRSALEAMTPQQFDAAMTMAPQIIPPGTPAQTDLVRMVDVRGDLSAVTAPTQVISTTADLLVVPALHHEVADGIPGAQLAELSTGHLAATENPRQWLTLITTFLDQTAGARR